MDGWMDVLAIPEMIDYMTEGLRGKRICPVSTERRQS